MTDYAYRRTQTYNDCLRQYSNDSVVKQQLFDALEELERDPMGSPKLNTHRVKRAKGKTFTSDVGGRKGKRLIWRLVGDRTIALLLLGEHDPTYRRAERLSLEYDEVEDRIRVFDAPPEDATAPTPYSERRQVEGTLFMAYSSRELEAFGFEPREIPVLRRLDEEDELLALETRMRPVAWQTAMNLFLYGHPEGLEAAEAQRLAHEAAEASEPEAEIDVDVEARLAAAILQPNSAIELPVVEEDIAEVLSKPIEDWMVFLHPSQRNLVERAYSGPARVRGAAGTGKTVVGLHRAAFLARSYDAPVLFTTYVRTLPPVLEQLFRRLAPDVADHVEFRNIHSWAARYLNSIQRGINIDTRKVNAAFNAAWTTCAPEGSPLAKSGLPKEYFREEIEWVIRGRGCRQLSDYTQLKRSGRGTPLGEKLRTEVWALYDEYRHQIRKHKTYDFSSLIEHALREVRERGRPTEYAAVIVDEAQDLTEMGIKLLYELAGRDRADGLMILGDGQQSIYPGGFSLGGIGVDVRGRSTILATNYRNTAEILAAAMQVVDGRPFDDLEADLAMGPRDVQTVRRGASPERHAYQSLDDHDLALGAAIVDSADRPDIGMGDMAVLVPTVNLVVRYAELLRGLGLSTQRLEDYEGVPNASVKVGTFKRSKGLEFKQVFLPRLDLIDLDDNSVTDPSEIEEQDLMRRSIFVAMTRARDRVWLGGVTNNKQTAWWTNAEPSGST